MTKTVSMPENALTWSVLREIYPVARSDRRLHGTLFAELQINGDAKIDEVFYPSLLKKIRADRDFLKRLNQEFILAPQSKEVRKSFGIRVGQWLANQAQVEFGDVASLPDDTFAHDPVAQELFNLYRDCWSKGSEDRETTQESPRADAAERLYTSASGEAIEPAGAAPEAADWLAQHRRLTALLVAFAEPDVDRAAAVLAQAQALHDACFAAAVAREDAEKRLATRRDGIAARLAELADALDRPDLYASEVRADAATLDALECSIETVDARLAEKERLAGEHAAAEHALEAAFAASAWDEVRRLGQGRDALRVDLKAAAAAVQAAVEALGNAAGNPEMPGDAPPSEPQKTVETVEPCEPMAIEAGSEEASRSGLAGAEDAVAQDEHAEVHPEKDDADEVNDGGYRQAASTGSEPAPQGRDIAAEMPGSTVGVADDGPAAERAKESGLEAYEVEPAAPATEAESPRAQWTGQPPLEEILAGYLDDGDYVLGWRLIELCEAAGLATPVPSAALAALPLVDAISGPDDGTAQMIGALLAAAINAVEALEAGGDERSAARARALLFAALLRPALLSPDTTARDHLRNLSMTGMLAAYGPLRTVLSDLGYDVRVDLEDIAELAGAARGERLPTRTAALREWLEQARRARGNYQPADSVLHRVLAPGGAIGSVVEAAMTRGPESEAALRALVSQLDEPGALERLISDTDRQIRGAKSVRIIATARNWCMRKLEEGLERMRLWLEACAADRRAMDDRRRDSLRRQLGAVRKAVAEIKAGADDTGDQGLDGAAQKVVECAIKDLAAVLDGDKASWANADFADRRAEPLLRLPGGCQDWAPDEGRDAFAREIAAARELLLVTLSDPSTTLAPDDEVAFERRLAEGAILPASALLARLRSRDSICGRSVEEAEQALAERREAARRSAAARVDGLRLDLATLHNLDLSTGDELRRWLDQLEDIAQALRPNPEANQPAVIPALDRRRQPDIPPDFPELDALLEQVFAFAGAARARIREGQRTRLLRLRDDRPAEADALEGVIDDLEDRDLITIEDMIANLQAGRSLGDEVAEEEDVFGSFFPGFVEAVEAASEDFKQKGRIDAALRTGERFGPIDFGHLDEDGRSSAKQLLEAWRRAGNALGGPPPKLREAVRDLVEALGFTSAQVSGDAALLSGRLIRLDLRTDPLASARGFVPPVFGSEALGVYPVLLARPDIQDDQLASELAKVGRDRPCLLLDFGRLSRMRRQNLAHRMRREKQSVLLVDETLVLFLSARAADRMETLITCAAPFGYVQPYTTNAGSIPTEMFFGRREEIEKIVSRRSDGCLVYGGRQLGKSALLTHVQKLYDRPETGFRVLYLKIDVIGGLGTPAAQIWREIGTALAGAGIGRRGQADPESVIDALRTWLDGDSARRILLLLDEGDVFLASEARARFPNLVRLKDLMEATERRFKVVFAGLHNVRRMAQAPNSPLVQLGDPICIGPLNTSPENSAEARRLVKMPMQAAGFDYADPALPWGILARVNHYPSLVQVFCKAMLEGLATQRRPVADGPRWQLTADQIFEGGSAREIARQIRDRFQWTLNLDPRYELIAKVLAYHRFLRPDGNEIVLRSGLSPAQLREEVLVWWPDSLEPLSVDDFGAFLDEMEDLGVLARYGPNRNRFGLRSAQVAQMLGGQAELEDEIQRIQEREPGVDYDAAAFHQRVSIDDPRRRSPLSDRSLAALLDPNSPGPRVVAAAPALWGADIAERLATIADGWSSRDGPIQGRVHGGAPASLRKLLDNARGQRLAVVLSLADGPDERFFHNLSAHASVRSGHVIPIVVMGAAGLARRRLDGSVPTTWQVFCPRPWSETMLRVWLADNGLDRLDHPDLRALIAKGTGGVAERLDHAAATLEAAVSDADPERALDRWSEKQSVYPADVGLPSTLEAPFSTLVQLAGPDAAGVPAEEMPDLQELMSPGADAGGSRFDVILRVFADLGLVRSGDPMRIGVALTPLGRHLARSMGPS